MSTRKQELRALNLNLQPHPDDSKQQLDVSLKKNSAMATRLKSINADNASKLREELGRLNFSKFLAEFEQSIVESCLKIRNANDLMAVLEIASYLHQRSGSASDFSRPLIADLLKLVVPCPGPIAQAAGSFEANPWAQNRLIIRVLAEFNIVGMVNASWIAASKLSLPVALRDVASQPGGLVFYLMYSYLKADEKADFGLLASYFAKYCGHDYLTSTQCMISAGNGDVAISPEVLRVLRKLFVDYYDVLCKRLLAQHAALKKMKAYSDDYQLTRGTLTEQQKIRLDVARKSHDHVIKVATGVAESLGFELPNLAADDEKSDFTVKLVDTSAHLLRDAEKDWHLTPWEDEENRSFYVDIPDLMNLVADPSVFKPQSAASKKKKERKEKKKSAVDDEEFDDDFYNGADFSLIESFEKYYDRHEYSEEDEPILPEISATAPVDSILLELPNLINRQLLDKAVVDFCNGMGSCREPAISKLIMTLVYVNRHRVDLLPFYSRFIATINKYIPEVGNTVAASLHSEFRRRFKKSDQISLEHRIKTVRYLGELAKFGICQPHVIFYCFKRVTQPEISNHIFNSQHAMVACALLESCGRYMMRIPEITKLFAPLLDIFVKKCKVTNLEGHVLVMLENALLIADPPAPKKIEKRERLRAPIELWIRKLIYTDLEVRTVDYVLEELKKLPWNRTVEMDVWDPDRDPDMTEPLPKQIDTRKLLHKIFTKAWKVRFVQIECLADVAAGLSEYYPDFPLRILDNVLEQIRVGMEDYTHFDFNQRRILMVRYLGELYNFEIATSETIFDTLYSLVTFGHPSGRPSRLEKFACATDASTDFFRIRLICELLDTCGSFFQEGNLGHALDQFLVLFQYYILTKDQELMPIDTQFAIEDIYTKLRPSLTRLTSYDEAYAALNQLQVKVNGAALEEWENDTKMIPVATEKPSPGQSNKNVPSKEEDDMFTKDFQELMAESMASRKNEKKTQLDVSVPVSWRQTSAQTATPPTDTEIKFRVLSKNKGMSLISVPAASGLAQASLSKRQEIKEEQQQIKERVLAIHARGDDT